MDRYMYTFRRETSIVRVEGRSVNDAAKAGLIPGHDHIEAIMECPLTKESPGMAVIKAHDRMWVVSWTRMG